MEDENNLGVVTPDLGKLLASNYLLAKLNVRIWSGKKTDKNATKQLLVDKGAVSNAASVIKLLLAGNDGKLKETTAAFTRIRSFFYENTSPWTTSSVGAMKGDRLISTVASITFLGDFAKLKIAADAALADFLQDYDQAVANAAVSLGGLYDAAQYPTKAAIATLFDASMDLCPIPESTGFDRLTNVPAGLATGLKDLYERNMEVQMNNALSDVQQRLMTELERMDTQLSKVANGEKTRLFKSMITNLKHLVSMARSLNFTNNTKITAIADAIENNLLAHDVEMYKDNASLAGANAAKARSIAKLANNADTWKIGGVNTVDNLPVSEAELNSTVDEQTSGGEELDSTVDNLTVPKEVIVGTQIVEPQEMAEVQQEENGTQQSLEDQSFLASLMEKVEEPEVEEPVSEQKKDEAPDFNADEFMF